MGEDSLFSGSYFQGENNHDENNKSNASPTNMNVDSDVNVSESKDAVTEIGIKHEVLSQFNIMFYISLGYCLGLIFLKRTFHLEFLNLACRSSNFFYGSVLWHIILSNCQIISYPLNILSMLLFFLFPEAANNFRES
jgi:hypothetical protein